MKKSILVTLLLAVIVSSSGCNTSKENSSVGENNSTTSSTTSETATATTASKSETSVTTTSVSETTSESEGTSETITDTESLLESDSVSDESKASSSALDGTIVKLPNGDDVDLKTADTKTDTQAVFDYMLVRKTTGDFISKEDKPELFDMDTFTYSGDKYSVDSQSWYKVKKGDKIGGLTVTEAQMTYSSESDSKELVPALSLDGEMTIDAYLWYHVAPDGYISEGDVTMYPIPSGMGDFPLINGAMTYAYFNDDPAFAFYGDTSVYILDSIASLKNGDALNESNQFAKARITISHLDYGWSGTNYVTISKLELL